MARTTDRVIPWLCFLVLGCGTAASCQGDDCTYSWVVLEDAYYWGETWSGAGWGVDVGDLDGDGLDELVVGNNCQYPDGCVNLGSNYTEVSGAYLLDAPYEGGRLGDVAVAYLGEKNVRSDSFGGRIDIVQDITGDEQVDIVVWGERLDDDGGDDKGWHVFAGPFEDGEERRRSEATAIVADQRSGLLCGRAWAAAVPMGDDEVVGFVTPEGAIAAPLAGELDSDDLCLTWEACGLASGDVDGDGEMDLVLTVEEDEERAEPTILAWSPAGGCGEEDPLEAAVVEWTLPSLRSKDTMIAGHDLDGDGIGDVVYAQSRWDADTDITKPVAYLLTDGQSGDAVAGYASFIPKNSGERYLSLAAGDFDGDGQADLAFGIDSASVHVFLGPIGPGDQGPADADALLTVCDQPSCDALSSCQEDEYFGASLAAGDLDGDGRDDLVIGAPKMEEEGLDDSGRVYIAWGGGL